MKPTLSLLAVSFISTASLFSAAQALATEEHKIVSPEEIKWDAGPAALPPGAQSVVLYGDPAKAGLFAIRLKLPKGYHIPPHTHPKPEVVTILSGAGRLGMGKAADESTTQKLSAGTFIALPPGMAHFVYVDEPSVVQLNSIGPWELNYLNPKDDPRKKTQ
jgi:quercetin dioxygenase-like cupin family protein